ncbi:MAG: DMT family transporter [Candidatus Micrarchaeia archaeon]
MKLRSKAFLLLALNIIGIGIYPVMLKAGAMAEDVLSFMLLVFGMATAVSFAYLLASHELESFKSLLKDRKTFYLLAFSGLLDYGIASGLEMLALVHLPANLAAIVRRSWVLLMVPFLPLVLKLKVNKYQLLGLALGFVAIYLVFTGGTIASVNYSALPWLTLLILTALSLALANVLIKSRQVSLPVELFLFNASTFAFFAIALPVAHFAFGYRIMLGFNPLTVSALLFLGLFTYFIGTYFYFFALKVLEPTTIGNATLAAPFVTFGFAFIIFHEQVYAYYLLLAALIIAGVVIQEKAPKKTLVRSRNEFKNLLFDISGAFAESKSEAVNSYFSGSGRALAMPLDMELEEGANEVMDKVASQYCCMVFDLKKPAHGIGEKEVEFIKDVLGMNEDQTSKSVLVGIGKPENVESAFKALSEAIGLTKSQNSAQKLQ